MKRKKMKKEVEREWEDEMVIKRWRKGMGMGGRMVDGYIGG